MKESFESLFNRSINDGSYYQGIRDKILTLPDKRYLGKWVTTHSEIPYKETPLTLDLCKEKIKNNTYIYPIMCSPIPPESHGLILTEDLNEIENYHLDLQKIIEIDPKIFSHTIFHAGLIGIFDGFDSDTGVYSTVLRIGFHVSLILDPNNNTTELINIYAFENQNSIKELIVFLDNQNFKNHDEFIEIRLRLCRLLMSMHKE